LQARAAKDRARRFAYFTSGMKAAVEQPFSSLLVGRILNR
jgi:hypothetical protein